MVLKPKINNQFMVSLLAYHGFSVSCISMVNFVIRCLCHQLTITKNLFLKRSVCRTVIEFYKCVCVFTLNVLADSAGPLLQTAEASSPTGHVAFFQIHSTLPVRPIQKSTGPFCMTLNRGERLQLTLCVRKYEKWGKSSCASHQGPSDVRRTISRKPDLAFIQATDEKLLNIDTLIHQFISII